MKVKSQSEITQSCLTPSDPMDCSPPGSSLHGIFQARVLEWGAIAFSVFPLLTYFYLDKVIEKAREFQKNIYFCFIGYAKAFDYVVEKAMAPHSSALAWKIPGTEEPGRLQSMGLQRAGHD